MDKHNKMLIDATHPEETRVVVLRNGRIEEFDYESASRKLLRGNIYLAKVTRVEPSLQAAFVDYGGNRHGFLAFSEIHPDYYQIPVADRELLKQEEAEEEARLEAEADERANRRSRRGRGGRERGRNDWEAGSSTHGSGDQPEDTGDQPFAADTSLPLAEADPPGPDLAGDAGRPGAEGRRDEATTYEMPARHEGADVLQHTARVTPGFDVPGPDDRRAADDERGEHHAGRHGGDDFADAPAAVGNVEDIGVVEVNGNGGGDNGEAEHVEEVTTEEDALEEVPERPRRRMRQYKIQEVIKRRQIILVQVVKEERGNKGAALTTYISLAGRYTVLMPNTGRGGGISRKITQPQDRKRLKAIAEELDVPEGMGLIVRTAGAARTKQEIKRDYEYLLRLWESVRELTLSSTAPCLVYEEGNLIKRSIRDLYSRDIDQVVVAGGAAHREAHDFMGMLMPGHGDNVVRYEGSEPLFTRFGIERQLNAMFSPYVTLRSGGYLVINQTEALVAIDVNSGKSTREFSIEETALNTNIEAAEEIARQLKLRDLAGLIVVDFIDMEEKRNNRSVERRLKDALRHDRARIQVGRISHFGLLEMSRQRLRTGVLEGSTSQCPHCQGTGIIRSTESVALAVLRGLEDALMKQPASLVATTTAQVALYILNHKRSFIVDMEQRHGITVAVEASEKMQGANFSIDRMAAPAGQLAPARASGAVSMDWGFDDADADADERGSDDVEQVRDEPRRDGNGAAYLDGDDEPIDGEARPESGGGQGEARSGRRRRRRRGRRDREGGEERVSAPYGERSEGGDHGRPGTREHVAGNGHREDDTADFEPPVADLPDEPGERHVERASDPGGEPLDADASQDAGEQGERRRGRRRGRRGGRGRGREQGDLAGGLPEVAQPGADQPAAYGMSAHEPEWRPPHVPFAGSDADSQAQRSTIIEFVDATPRRSDAAPSAGILETSSNGSADPVAPIPAYPKAAPMPSWSEPVARPAEPARESPEQVVDESGGPGTAALTASLMGSTSVLAHPSLQPIAATAPEAEAAPAAASPVAAVTAEPEHRPEPGVATAPSSADAPGQQPEPAMAAGPAAEREEPAQPPRRGWWQRRFGSGA